MPTKRTKAVAALVALGGIGGLAAFSFIAGNGSVTVIAPADSSLTVQLDGKPAGVVAVNEHLALSLPQGDHQVVLTDQHGAVTKHDLHVKNGGMNDVLPAANECFALIDVTNLVYEKVTIRQKVASEVSVDQTFADHKPFEVPTTYFPTSELPSTIKSGEHVKMLFTLPCPAIASGTDAILDAIELPTEKG